MPRSPKTRRHLAYAGTRSKPERFRTTYRGMTGPTVSLRFIVNTGRDWYGMDEGLGTNRVKRFRRWIEAVSTNFTDEEIRLELSAAS